MSHMPLAYVLWKMKGMHAVVVAFEERFNYLNFDRFFQNAFPQLFIPRN